MVLLTMSLLLTHCSDLLAVFGGRAGHCGYTKVVEASWSQGQETGVLEDFVNLYGKNRVFQWKLWVVDACSFDHHNGGLVIKRKNLTAFENVTFEVHFNLNTYYDLGELPDLNLEELLESRFDIPEEFQKAEGPTSFYLELTVAFKTTGNLDDDLDYLEENLEKFTMYTFYSQFE